MKTLIAVLVMLCAVNCSAEWVNGYYRSNGTYVSGYYRTDRNNTIYDNRSYKPYRYEPKADYKPTYEHPGTRTKTYNWNTGRYE